MSSNRRLIGSGLVLALTAFSAGCIGIGGNDAISIWDAASSAFSDGEKVSLQEASSVPYASIGLQIGDSSQLMLLLATDTAGLQLWTSSARIAITTDRGRITRTSGLEHNLGGLEPRRTGHAASGKTTHWLADFPDLGLYSISITCQERPVGKETIDILGKELYTNRFEDDCKTDGDALDWSFKNTYWRDPASGLAWRSIQHVHPSAPIIVTETLRPPV